MKGKTIILYDLTNKKPNEKVRIAKKLYGYRDKSNYEYSYDRNGLLNNIELKKSKKIVLEVENKEDIHKIMEIFKRLKVNAEIARI